jgi:hypothetical protein
MYGRKVTRIVTNCLKIWRKYYIILLIIYTKANWYTKIYKQYYLVLLCYIVYRKEIVYGNEKEKH